MSCIRAITADLWPGSPKSYGFLRMLITLVEGVACRIGRASASQQRYTAGYEESGDPAAAINFFMEKDFGGAGVADEC